MKYIILLALIVFTIWQGKKLLHEVKEFKRKKRKKEDNENKKVETNENENVN